MAVYGDRPQGANIATAPCCGTEVHDGVLHMAVESYAIFAD
jgi:hypothetical protein